MGEQPSNLNESTEPKPERVTRDELINFAKERPMGDPEVEKMLVRWLEETRIPEGTNKPSIDIVDVAIMHTLTKYKLGFLSKKDALRELEESKIALESEQKDREIAQELNTKLLVRIGQIENDTFEIVGMQVEESLSVEQSKKVTRQEALDAYKKFIEREITNPDSLDPSDPEVEEAHELFYAWQEQEDAQAQGDIVKELKSNLSKTMFYVDAGFTHPDYLNDVLVWLSQDDEEASEQGDDPQIAEVRSQITLAIERVKGLLK